MKIAGRIDKIEEKKTIKSDGEVINDTMKITDKDGMYKVTVKAPHGSFKGFAPEEHVQLEVVRVQKTIAESTNDSARKKHVEETKKKAAEFQKKAEKE